MKPTTYIFNKFSGYSSADCDCKYCLHFAGADSPCPLPECCCAEEKRQAAARESVAEKCSA